MNSHGVRRCLWPGRGETQLNRARPWRTRVVQTRSTWCDRRTGELGLLLIIFDNFDGAHLRLVGVVTELSKGAALAQQIPALVELDL